MVNDPALEALARLLIRNQQFAGAKTVNNAPPTPPSTVQAMPPPPTPPSTVQAAPPAAGNMMGSMVGQGVGAGMPPTQQPPQAQPAPPLPPQQAPAGLPPMPPSQMIGASSPQQPGGFWDDLRRQLMNAQGGALPQRYGQGGEIA